MTQIQISTLEKVKKALNIKENIDSFDLYDLLCKSRNNSHPDKYQDDSLKKQAEEKFKEYSSLLKELEFQIH